MKRPLLPLSKCMDPAADYPRLGPELELVDRHNAVEGQVEQRRWEYAMAHRAIAEWQATQSQADGWEDHPLRACDVGGAGSRFALTLTEVATTVDVVDPALTLRGPVQGISCFPTDLWQHGATQPHDQYDILTAISVLEHIPDAEIRRFLRAAKMLLRRGGLLFLTLDCWNAVGPDTAHFHWMRQRIYNPDLIRALQQTLRELGFLSFGKGDWAYSGDHLFGSYSFASLVMVRA